MGSKRLDVYKLYRFNPNSGKSSYLYHHYLRGRQGIMRPTKSRYLALAAWHAGADSVEGLQQKSERT